MPPGTLASSARRDVVEVSRIGPDRTGTVSHRPGAMRPATGTLCSALGARETRGCQVPSQWPGGGKPDPQAVNEPAPWRWL